MRCIECGYFLHDTGMCMNDVCPHGCARKTWPVPEEPETNSGGDVSDNEKSPMQMLVGLLVVCLMPAIVVCGVALLGLTVDFFTWAW